jgi:hypothetical protein
MKGWEAALNHKTVKFKLILKEVFSYGFHKLKHSANS